MALLSLILANPLIANAGVFSYLSSFFVGKILAQDKPNIPNSQNVSLLQPSLNPDPNSAMGGGDITVVDGTALLPETGPSGTIADIVDENKADQISIYVVRPGDSILTIAKMFNVSANTIIWANDLPNAKAIKEGQTLVILPISGIKHTVTKGETIKGIATKYKSDVDEITKFNNLQNGQKLTIGTEIIIPDGELAPSSSSGRINTNEPVHNNTGIPNYEGYYMRPIAGGVRTQGLHGYNAVDLADSVGTPIFAAADGDVIISRYGGWNGGYGNYVVIAHANGTQTLYAHMSKQIVFGGYHVVQGQVIGYIGSTGKSTGPHLHFEVRGAVNPF